MEQPRKTPKSNRTSGIKTHNKQAKTKYLSFTIKNDLSGLCEFSFEGSLTRSFLKANHPSLDGIFEHGVDLAYIDLLGVGHIDDDGVEFLLRLMKQLEREGVKFQLIYTTGRVGSKIEKAGLTNYFAKPTWAYIQ